MSSDVSFLNRYTTLPVLIDLLRRKKLVLLDPGTWEDRNDSQILEEYKRRKEIDKLFALCFSCETETIHHWKTFSDGTSGCCIQFHGPRMLKLFSRNSLRHGKVTYKKLKDVKNGEISIDDIPFTKRWPYRCEEEYRLLWEGSGEACKGKACHEIDVPLEYINKITISQRMPAPVFQTIKDYLREAFQNPDKKINRSTLFENKIWIDKFKNS